MKKVKVVGFLAIWIAVVIVAYSYQSYRMKKDITDMQETSSIVESYEATSDYISSEEDASIIENEKVIVNANKWIDDAAAVFEKENDHAAAVAVLRNAIEEANREGDEIAIEQYENAIMEYATYEPISLAALEPVQDRGHISTGYYQKDVNGVMHENPFFMNGVWGASDDNVYQMFNLNFEYSSFSGTVYRTYESLSCTQWDYEPYVKIYGDDILLWESPSITLDTYDPIDFEVDVTGVRNLKLYIAGQSYHDPWICVGDTKLQK